MQSVIELGRYIRDVKVMPIKVGAHINYPHYEYIELYVQVCTTCTCIMHGFLLAKLIIINTVPSSRSSRHPS